MRFHRLGAAEKLENWNEFNRNQRLRKNGGRNQNAVLSYKIFEMDANIGGRALAAKWLSGPENPLKVILDKDILDNNPVLPEPPYAEQDFLDIKWFAESGVVS